MVPNTEYRHIIRLFSNISHEYSKLLCSTKIYWHIFLNVFLLWIVVLDYSDHNSWSFVFLAKKSPLSQKLTLHKINASEMNAQWYSMLDINNSRYQRSRKLTLKCIEKCQFHGVFVIRSIFQVIHLSFFQKKRINYHHLST